jgi:hypothetical protein
MPKLHFWRAPTDNDRGWANYEATWRKAGYESLQHRLDSIHVEESVETTTVVVKTRIAPPKFIRAITAEYRYTFYPSGEVCLDVAGEFTGEWPETVPRIGLQLLLPEACAECSWFGFGPGESYIDTHQAARLGVFKSDVDAMFTPYVLPQENGNRHNTRWLELTTAEGKGIRLDGKPTIDFSAHRYTAEQLTAAKHTTDLVPGKHVVLNLDLAQNGIGSNSCGPTPLPQHLLRPHAFKIQIAVSPV